MVKRLSLVVVLGLLLVLTVTTVQAQSAGRSYLITAQGNSLPANLEAQVRAAGGVLTRTYPQLGIAVASSSNPNFTRSIRGVRSVVPNVIVQWVDPTREVRYAFDGEFGNPPTSGDDDTRFDLQWGHDAVNAPEAWNAGVRGAGVRVAVLDTGFDTDHPDLAPNINFALSASFVPGEGLTYALPDPFSHGSHTAGTIAAADNGRGTIGVAPEAELVLVKVLRDSGSGAFDWVISGIVHAANVDADVINMSLGAVLVRSGFLDDNGTPNPADDVFVTAREVAELVNAVNRATTYAYQMGTTVIASAGNEAIDFDHSANVIHIPSGGPHVLSISATTPIGWAVDPANAFLDYPTSYTNFGQSGIDFAAPGGDVLYPGNENCTIAGLTRPCWVFDLVFSTGSNLNPALASYYWSGGTSMAAPHVSGIAALIISENGGSMHPAQVEAALRARADDLGKPGNDDFYGAGRVSSGY
ncbi:MAG: S8 family serine peptidase [Chloroflexi bacterium]|nr:S8 family serine peptidase [Chloroflexota bacterium]